MGPPESATRHHENQATGQRKRPRTPVAWLISLLPLIPTMHAFSAWLISLISVLFQILLSEWVTSAKRYRVTFA